MTMNTQAAKMAVIMALMMSAPALAADGETSASASSGRGRSGTAAASAHYAGDVGFARSDTRTGRINLARGVALGVDENGLALSVSTAIAPRFGPAIATTFNMSLGRDGHSSASFGTALAQGPAERGVSAGGATTSRPGGATIASASGQAPGGVVRVAAGSQDHPPRMRPLRPVGRPEPRPILRPRVMLRR
jgi:hypothetical protein